MKGWEEKPMEGRSGEENIWGGLERSLFGKFSQKNAIKKRRRPRTRAPCKTWRLAERDSKTKTAGRRGRLSRVRRRDTAKELEGNPRKAQSDSVRQQKGGKPNLKRV